ncbi:signaling peptide TAXIMIN 2-like [Rhododendron vialii]|uniref:signaling peptide TAXIMIN 2-like n=1 Tax=Rhododendron vialii TaxID=182163 RepID=UPI00265ED465|nr:signaling peptide TAXIMIN 2-like [Rhododendron vialii]
MGDCRPLGFLLGLPFALVALVLSLLGAIVWLLGSLLTCVCPCCCCCAGVANVAMELMTLPLKIITWFTDQIPC